MQMQDINVQKNSSSRFSFPSLPAHIVSPEDPVDVRVSVCRVQMLIQSKFVIILCLWPFVVVEVCIDVDSIRYAFPYC